MLQKEQVARDLSPVVASWSEAANNCEGLVYTPHRFASQIAPPMGAYSGLQTKFREQIHDYKMKLKYVTILISW